MSVTASDYAWFFHDDNRLAESYCVTLIEDLNPVAVIGRVHGTTERVAAGIDDVYEIDEDTPEGSSLVAVSMIGDWAMMVEPRGSRGVRRDIALALSAGRTIVSNFRNVNAVDQFVLAKDGVILLEFMPLTPKSREGSSPENFAAVMADLGFDLSRSAKASIKFDPHAAAFAFAEILTGVRIEPEVLGSSDYLCAYVL